MKRSPKDYTLSVITSILMVSVTTVCASDSAPMKMTTSIPSEITTPDKVETRLGTLNFNNGMPDKATIKSG